MEIRIFKYAEEQGKKEGIKEGKKQ